MPELTAQESAALEAVEPAGVVQLAAGMVPFASQIPNEGPLAEHLYRELRRMGGWDDVRLQPVVPGRANVVARVKGHRPGRTLLLNGHLDIPAPFGEWTRDPYVPEVTEGWLYGVGVGDMKAGVACLLAAAAAIAKSRALEAGSLVVSAVIHHDVCGLGTKFFLASSVERYDAAINGEPTNLKVQVAHGGAIQFEIVTRGVAAHTSRLHEGKDAIGHMAEVLTALRGWTPPLATPASIVGLPRMVIGKITGGVSPSRTSEECVASGDVRFPPEVTSEEVLASLRRAVASIGGGIDGFEAEVRPTVQQIPFRIERDAEIVGMVARAHEDVTGRAAEVSDSLPPASFVTDCSDLSRAGIPSVIYGPADWKTEPDERVRVDDLVIAARVYALSALRFLGAEP